MKNVIIMGSPRSGTSLMSGLLSEAGYYMGPKLVAPREANPKGFFESAAVNDINESILAQVLPEVPWGQRWSMPLKLTAPLCHTLGIGVVIQNRVSNSPFCFKDPRFCYTLPIWRPYLEDTIYICVFRHPAQVANSIIKEWSKQYGIFFTETPVYQAIYGLYNHILTLHRHVGDWLFVHYNELFNEDTFQLIEELLQVDVLRSFPDVSLNRSLFNTDMPTYIEDQYRQLCELAGYEGV